MNLSCKINIKSLCLLLISFAVAIVIGEAILQLSFKISYGFWLYQEDDYYQSITQNKPFSRNFSGKKTDSGRQLMSLPLMQSIMSPSNNKAGTLIKFIDGRRRYTLSEGYKNIKESITINSFGFRGNLINENINQIFVVLGGSVSFGYGVKDEQTYPYVLEKMINVKNNKIGVLNAAVPSYNLQQSFDRLNSDVFKYYKNISLVIIESSNDPILAATFKENYNCNTTFLDYQIHDMKRKYYNIAFLYYIDKAIEKVVGNKYSDEMLNNVNNILETNLQSLNKSSIPVIILPINPFYYQTKNIHKNSALKQWKLSKHSIDSYNDIAKKYNPLLKNISQRYPNAFFLDIVEIMDNLNRDELYIDFIHYSPKGNQVLAKAVFDFLIEKKLLSK